MIVRTEPEVGQTYDWPTLVHGVRVSDFWKVYAVTGTRRRSVFLRRCGDRLERRIGLNEFNAACKRGEFHPSP